MKYTVDSFLDSSNLLHTLLYPMVSIAICLCSLYNTPLSLRVLPIDKPGQDIRVIIETACLNIVELDFYGLKEVLLS